MSKHTPGPWMARKGSVQTDRRMVFCGAVGDGECRANLILASAAPEMLELLQELVDQPGQLHEDVCAMRRLIAKATGERK